ncbi:hypothetical protein [Nocardia cyriacigeorgica]|uniref:hypothetical protein n=1 Tax=Nocardia cyriacigeorgica TaxID=135487 RepID=UPI001E322A18|nr:hypothetical protein [Nocardia cyriacigeorgica]
MVVDPMPEIRGEDREMIAATGGAQGGRIHRGHRFAETGDDVANPASRIAIRFRPAVVNVCIRNSSASVRFPSTLAQNDA